MDVKFTVVPDADEGGAKYMDPVTKDALTNRSTLVLIKTTGDVMHKVRPGGEVGPMGSGRPQEGRERGAEADGRERRERRGFGEGW